MDADRAFKSHLQLQSSMPPEVRDYRAANSQAQNRDSAQMGPWMD